MHLDDSNEAQTCGTSSSMNIQQSDENLSSIGAQYNHCTVNVFQSGSAQPNSGQPTSNYWPPVYPFGMPQPGYYSYLPSSYVNPSSGLHGFSFPAYTGFQSLASEFPTPEDDSKTE